MEETLKIIHQLHGQGVTILLVEQNARKALQTAERGYLLETGQIVMSDMSSKPASNPRIKKAYLGHGVNTLSGFKAAGSNPRLKVGKKMQIRTMKFDARNTNQVSTLRFQ